MSLHERKMLVQDPDCDTQWNSLNDILPEGDMEVWYMKPDFFRDGICGVKPDRNALDRTHVLLGSIKSLIPDNLDYAWMELQGERWSPKGNARNLLKAKGLEHTSMSVGDCFRFKNGEVWVVAAFGFELVR